MTQEIESVKPAISVVIDDGDFIINSTGPLGKAMSQAILPLAAGAHRVTIIADGSMTVLKRNGAAQQIVAAKPSTPITHRMADLTVPSGPDIQDQFAADLEAGLTGEQAMGEVPSPTPGPSDPVKIPSPAPGRRRPQIFQDAAAPPAPELAEAEMDRLLAEAQQAEADAAKAAEDQRFQRQQAVQANQDPPTEAEAKPTPRKREPRSLATTGKMCGRCGGNGQIVGEAGFTGSCPVCLGEGQVKTWDRSLKVR